jgi:signal transduction histidine kinase
MRVDSVSKDEIGQLANSMNGMLESIETSKNSMKMLLDNVVQGFLSIDKLGKISSECSKASEVIYGVNPAGKYFWEVIGQDKDKWLSNLEMVFQEALDFKDLVVLLPQTLTLNNLTIDFEYRAVRNLKGGLEYLMVVATDVTRLRQLQAEAERERKENSAIVKILTSKNDFMEALELVESLQNFMGDLTVYKRYLHTLKGSFAFLDCTELSHVCHNWEKTLNEDGSVAAAKKSVSDIQKHVAEFTAKHAAVLNLDTKAEKTLPVSISAISTLYHEASRHNTPEPVRNLIEKLSERPAEEVFAWVNDAAQATAGQLDKELHPLHWEPSVAFDPTPYKALFKSMIHIVRNAVDHGIEGPDDREQFGKDRKGKLLAKFTLDANGMYTFTLKDDGQGIDPDVIRKRAESLKLKVPASDAEAINLIFDDGFSTRTEVSTTSGRGVGLAAVRAEARALGGDVVVKSAVGEGSEFIISFRRNMPGKQVLEFKKAV